MTSERWPEIERLCHAALERDERERAAFLEEACKGDESLRREVEFLLEQETEAEDFLEAPALEVAAQAYGEPQVHSMLGKEIGSYKILSLLGSGGMGEVYLAEDTTLDRKVALKFLPEEMRQDETARKRFLREAKSAAALDHPFICKIYEIGEAEETPYIAMEYVKGTTLKEKFSQGPPPWKDVLETALEIAEALEAAHNEDIVHRDLKPLNVMITPEGHVKVMDFGLAKRLVPVEGVDRQEQSLTAGLSKTGMTLGTLAYMSPGQVRGKTVDTRSDIFSFGVMLYEMLTGVHPFQKDLPMDTAQAILRQDPAPLTQATEDVPELVQHTVRKMLAKEPERRYQLVHDVRTNLTQVLSQTAPSQRGEPSLGRGKRVLWRAVAMLVVFVMVFIGWWLFRGETTVVAPEQITSIAVLPLDNLMGDSEQEYFVEGMHEALITNLSKIGALKVISRTSVMRYKERKPSIPEIADELGVDAMIEGSVLRAGNRVRITAQLIHGTTDRHLWAESYERDLSDVLSLQGEVARAIAQEIKIEVTPQEEKRLASAGPIKDEAYLSYLKGRYFLDQRSAVAARKANERFKQALEKDPDSALAYAGLADSYFVLGYFGPAKEFFPRAKVAAVKALELDDSLAEAHTSMGIIRMFYEWDWSGAERAFKRALELNPGSAEAHAQYGELLGATGRSEEGVAEFTLALELDPLSFVRNLDLAHALVTARQSDRAMEQALRAVEMFPNSGLAHLFLGYA